MAEQDTEYDLPGIQQFVTDVEGLRQKQSEANTAHASRWKDVDELGVNKRALKMFMQVKKLSHNERVVVIADFQRLIDDYRDELGLDDVLFDTATGEVPSWGDEDAA